ncbi:ecto-ADP-ribosyltransferase 5-like isoform X2 [Esox lucius]|nr:ecto-ADP-ribosyltransferase 5-like isoform X2 [Esox lucius]
MARDKILYFAVLFLFNAFTLSVYLMMGFPGLNSPHNEIPLSMVLESVDDSYDGCTVEMKKKGSPGKYSPKEIPLSMVLEAVDDMYDGCTVEMKDKVKEYLKKEMKQNPFKDSWNEAKTCLNDVKERFKKDKDKFNDAELENDHIKAICAYTAKKPPIYDKFNEDVRTQKNQYTTTFQYHTLHFWLTDAVRLLKEKDPECITSYRRTKDIYIGEVNKEMRFGYFASSSLDNNSNKIFGEESCFEIFTCFGAYLQSYPGLGNSQREVLIPPYEVFKITAVSKKKDNSLWCKTVYKLNSTKKPLSNLNCKMVSHSAEYNL